MVALNLNHGQNVEIDLAEPFENLIAAVLSLPTGCRSLVRDPSANEAHFRRGIRGLYEAANGRQVETTVGFIAIAPPPFEFLKATPFQVGTRTDFLIEAAARLIAGPASANFRNATVSVDGEPKSPSFKDQNPWIMTEIAKASTPSQKKIVGSATRIVARPRRSLRRAR